MGVMGNDAVAAHVRSVLKDLGVDISHVRRHDGENGYAVVDLVDGERVFVSSNKGGVLREHPIVLTESDLAYISAFDIVHTSNNSYIDSQLKILSTLPPLLSYDFSLSWRDWERAASICGHVDFCFLSCSDMNVQDTSLVMERIYGFGCGCGCVIATRGSDGAMAYDGSVFHDCPAANINPGDTMGAGDSLAAGFMTKYAELAAAGHSMGEAVHIALEHGISLSAKTCMVRGAFGHGVEIA
jgi:sugar/nucleoside kinase (ribokinase family)